MIRVAPTTEPHADPAMLRAAGMSPPSLVAAARRLQAEGRDVVRLDIGEPDFPTPPHVVEAGIRAMRDGDTKYVAPEGVRPLREAIAASVRARGIEAAPDRVIVTSGAKPMLLYSLLALVRPGDEVLVPDPGYPGYASAAAIAGGRAVPYPLVRQGGAYRLHTAALRARIGARTRVLVLNAPGNPTGAVLDDADLAALRDLVLAHDLHVVSDEVYSALVFDGAAPRSIAAFPDMAERTVVVDSFSKTYAMTGWRLGYGVVPAALVGTVAALVADSTTCAPGFVQQAGIAALTGPSGDVERMRAAYRERRDLVTARLAAVPGVEAAAPRGGFYAFADVSALLARHGAARGSGWLAERLLHEHGLSCIPGSAFGALGEGHLRLSFASPVDRLEEGIRRLARFAAEREDAAA